MHFLHDQRRPWSGMILAAVVLAILPQMATAQIDLPTSVDALSDEQESHPIDPALQMARDSLSHIQSNVQDYTALFIKRLRIDGALQDRQFALMKIRNRESKNGNIIIPMAVYLKFLKPSSVKGREVIWVEGKNSGKLIVHETGFKNLIRLKLDPTGYLAMRGQRYPISDIGLENLVRKVIEVGERDRKHGECEVRFFKNTKVGKSVCTMMQIDHPIKRSYFDFYRARVFFDDDLNVPIRYAAWSWPVKKGGQPVLKEEYTYTNVKLNVGLTESDFDPDNSKYNYP